MLGTITGNALVDALIIGGAAVVKSAAPKEKPLTKAEKVRAHTDARFKAKLKREDLNAQTRRSDSFQHLCGEAKITPTTRQASKFRRGFGKAFQTQQASHG